jgi:hypothetical protein
VSNNKLYQLAMHNLEVADAGTEKQSFIPMLGGTPPPPDPAAGGMPMDPAMAAGGGGMPMDPSMAAAGGAMPPMDPSMAMLADPTMGGQLPVDPNAAAMGVPVDAGMAAGPAPAGDVPPELYDLIVQAVRQVLQESGALDGKGEGDGESEKPKKLTTSERLNRLEETLGIGDNAAPVADGLSAGSGEASEGEGAMAPEQAMAMPLGPLDPAAGPQLGALLGQPSDALKETVKRSGVNDVVMAAVRKLRS